MWSHQQQAEGTARAQREPKQGGSAEISPKELCSHITRRKGLLTGTESTTDREPTLLSSLWLSAFPQSCCCCHTPALGWHRKAVTAQLGPQTPLPLHAQPPPPHQRDYPESPSEADLSLEVTRAQRKDRQHCTKSLCLRGALLSSWPCHPADGSTRGETAGNQSTVISQWGHHGTDRAQKCCSTLLL